MVKQWSSKSLTLVRILLLLCFIYFMYKRYYYPLHLFLILEKTLTNFWTSEVLVASHYVNLVTSKWFTVINYVLKYELFLNNSTLIENTAVDTLKYNNLNKYLKVDFKKNRISVIYSYYIYLLKLRLTFFVYSLNTKKINLYSLDKIYKNANWLERETSEMYGVLYYWKNDSRKLLLEYSKVEYPLLKDFPSEGVQDVFFNFFENQVIVQKNEIIEL